MSLKQQLAAELLSSSSGFLDLASLRHELLKLSLNGGVADLLILQYAVDIDGKRVRNRAYSKESCQWPFKAAVAILKPSHLMLRDKALPRLLVLIEAYANDD